MSHFAVLIVGDDIEEKLAPYDENMEYKGVITKEELIAKGKKSIKDYVHGPTWQEWVEDPEAYKEKHKGRGIEAHFDYLEKGFPAKLLWTDEQIYQDELKWYTEEDINEDGSVVTRYNPKSKWDWYQVGGRWSGMLRAKPGKTGILGERSWTNEDAKIAPEYFDSMLKGDVDWDHEDMKDFATFAVIDRDGNWIEQGSMGWWGCVSDENKDWTDTFKRIFDDIKDNERITVIDCHI